MIRLIQWLIHGHLHKWKTINYDQVLDTKREYSIGALYELQCEICGTVKRKNFRN